MVRGYDNFCVDLCHNPQFARALLDKITDSDIGLWDAFLGAVGEYVQVVCQGDDLGMQTGTFIAPDMYREFIKPCHKRMYDFIKTKTKAKIFMHSCGSVYDIIPDLIDVGVDILNPLQCSAAKMDISGLKRAFGRELCFWGGGIDVQQVLPYATLQEIEDTVKKTIDVLAPGGGYVFVPAHNIQADISPDRILRVYETALKYREYRVIYGASSAEPKPKSRSAKKPQPSEAAVAVAKISVPEKKAHDAKKKVASVPKKVQPHVGKKKPAGGAVKARAKK
jgi:uroporphyrinogen decarboxylase